MEGFSERYLGDPIDLADSSLAALRAQRAGRQEWRPRVPLEALPVALRRRMWGPEGPLRDPNTLGNEGCWDLLVVVDNMGAPFKSLGSTFSNFRDSFLPCTPAPAPHIPSCLQSGSPRADAKMRVCVQQFVGEVPRGSQASPGSILGRASSFHLVPQGKGAGLSNPRTGQSEGLSLRR